MRSINFHFSPIFRFESEAAPHVVRNPVIPQHDRLWIQDQNTIYRASHREGQLQGGVRERRKKEDEAMARKRLPHKPKVKFDQLQAVRNTDSTADWVWMCTWHVM